MKLTRILLAILCLVTLISGCIFDSDDDSKSDSAKKGSVSGTVKLSVTGDPVAGMKIYLVSANVKVDSSDIASILGRSAFVDSALTDSEGKYSITGIASGDYGVYPVNEDTTSVYTFTQAAGSDSCAFSMNGESLSVNFIAEKTDYPGAEYQEQIRDEVLYRNCTPTSAFVYRRYWALWVPFVIEDTAGIGTWNAQGEKYTFNQVAPGFTIVGFTLDNCFFYEVMLSNGEMVKFTLYHPLTGYNLNYYYIYDHSTKTLTECEEDFR